MAGVSERTRLDQFLVDRGLSETRARARDAILRGHVRVDGVAASKPGQLVSDTVSVDMDDPASAYVSRAALKLVAALDHFSLDIAGRVALDIGASTGGFTQVALLSGARHVVAIDVGHGQMHPSIAADPRVTRIDGLNARALTRPDLGGHPVDLIVSDVSFISLKLALPPALSLAEPGALGIFLVKPQFEAGRDAIGKGGLLKDRSQGEAIARDMSGWLGAQDGWRPVGTTASPIAGGDGNREYLLVGRKA
ncbi:TlyA family RNA methyltransferase [Aureimonas altamirensis]|uniref:TlyA family RNA methyltransferase n=1 Tax=Aureimonas altamirensis TaxID=370622 RepID=UPI0025534D66|nr:TlyA family RNA methyltransferase [Aureimonas altamirensis]